MATTPNLGITHIEANQAQKEVTANEGFDILDEGLAGQLTHDMASDANYTLDTSEPDKEHENLVLHITDTSVNLTTTRDIILPDSKQLHVAWNATAQTLRFKTASGTAYSVAAGDVRLFYIDSSNDAQAVSDDGAAPGYPTFLNITDTPASYSGEGGKVLKVKGSQDGVEFVTESAASGVFWAVPYKGALVDLASAITAVNASAGYAVVWDTEVRDTDSFVNLGVNATRITIPAGFSLARFAASLIVNNLTANQTFTVKILKNGTALADSRMDTEIGQTTRAIQVTTPVISVSNTDYFEVQITTESDTNIDVAADSWFQLEIMETTGGGNPPYDVGMFYSGIPGNSQEVLRLEATRGFTVPDGATGSNALARVASTGDVTFSIKRNGSEFATCRFNITAAGVFTQSGDETFAEDDDLTIVAPATADASLEDISIFLKGTRTT
jgi:hypothetical protein